VPPPAKSRDQEAEVPGRWARSKVGMGERGTPVIWIRICGPSRIPEAFQGDTNVSFLTETLIRNGPGKCRWVRASRVIEGWMRS